MEVTQTVAEGVYLIGGPNVTRSEDAAVFAVDCGGQIVLIDSGAGRSVRALVRNLEKASLDPGTLSTIILTHCHIDHIGGAPSFKKQYGCRLIIHELDAGAVESADPVLTAADLYGADFPPTPVDQKITGKEITLEIGTGDFRCIHTPGHTPGSISILLERGGQKILFGQDIHGPFLPAFRSDIYAWRESMELLLGLEADILCEGHFGIFRSREAVSKYIRNYLDRNARF